MDTPQPQETRKQAAIKIVAASVLIVVAIVGATIWQTNRDRNYDEITTIREAKILEKSQGIQTRRTVRSYTMDIQESGKDSLTRVTVPSYLYFACNRGDTYTDLPGEKATCSGLNPLEDVDIIEAPDIPEITIPSLEPYPGS